MAKRPTPNEIVTALESIAATATPGDTDETVALATEVRAWGVDRHQLGREAAQFSNMVEGYSKTGLRADWQRVQAAATRLAPHFRNLDN